VKGIYALIICLKEDTRINVDAIGKIGFNKGTYVYVGSAQTNLEQRVGRHLRKNKRLFWHVDYLLNNDAAKIRKRFACKATKRLNVRLPRRLLCGGNP